MGSFILYKYITYICVVILYYIRTHYTRVYIHLYIYSIHENLDTSIENFFSYLSHVILKSKEKHKFSNEI